MTSIMNGELCAQRVGVKSVVVGSVLCRTHPWVAGQRGYTLVEVMIVMTIVAAITATIGISAFAVLEKMNIKNTELKLKKVSNKAQEFYAYHAPNRLPESIDDLVEPPDGVAPFLTPDDTRDAWGTPILFERSGHTGYLLRSVGPDGAEGTEDDIELKGS